MPRARASGNIHVVRGSSSNARANVRAMGSTSAGRALADDVAGSRVGLHRQSSYRASLTGRVAGSGSDSPTRRYRPGFGPGSTALRDL